MSMDASLHELARQVRDLVNCDTACLVLDCPDPALRHPLLDLFPSNASRALRCYGSTPLASLLNQETLRALYDVAVQTGRVQISNQQLPETAVGAISGIAIVPVEQPAGVLGFFLLANPRMGSREGEGTSVMITVPQVRTALSLPQQANCIALAAGVKSE